jgi:molybdate transport system ATP-binding protein
MAVEVSTEQIRAEAMVATSSNGSLAVEITKTFAAADREFILEIASDFPPGITILFGPSGAGKTTLLDCIAGLTAPDGGRIGVGNQIFFDAARNADLPVHRRRVGYVFQDLALFPHLSAEKNIAYGLSARGGAERRRRIEAILESLRISHLRHQRPGEISGGERQRVALARALVTDPCVLLLDEPLAALDAPTKSKIIDDLRAWNQGHRIPIVYVTHSRDEVFALGERVLVIEDGKVVARGTPHEVMTAPQTETVAQLAGFENILDATVIALHADRGTMTCSLTGSSVELETPLVRAATGSALRVGIRAGDILLATIIPQGLSARNVIAGELVSLEQRDMIVAARVDCGVEMEVHLTLAARDALHLKPGRDVWLVIKTHSCHLMAGSQ